jgi:methionyl-tRNA formyltransferase
MSLRIVFMGTPEFAVATLDALYKNNYNIVGVITVPDKPAGRGYEFQESAVKKYAKEKGLLVLQPEKLKAENFIEAYQALQPDLNIVVAFRMLPEVIWAYPAHGTFNLHASLLPQYRGAAPINWAIINGETETGATTFFIDKEIDTGKIILNDRVNIEPTMNAGELHDILMVKGAELVIKTVKAIENNEVSLTEQSQLIENQKTILRDAPKIFKQHCLINIENSLVEIQNQIRGLSPYPAAIARFTDVKGSEVPVKIYSSHIEAFENTANIGDIDTDGKTFLAIEHPEGRIFIDELQLPGKKRLAIADYLRGSQLSTGNWKLKPL